MLDCILLVDDNVDGNYILKKIIQKLKITERVDICFNGQEALDYLKRENSFDTRDPKEGQPNIIFLDINMPIMDGWEFLEHYNQLPPEVKAGQVVFMLTTSLDPDDKKRALEMGIVEEFITKPINRKKLLNIVEQYKAAC